MPDRSGYEVCTFVRAQRALANTPVLLISGIVNDEVTKQAESCHADGVLKKPFQGTSLKDRVLELLAKRQSTATPVAKTPEKVIEPIELIQGSSESGDQLEAHRQAVTRVQSLEEELRIERGRVAYSAQRVVQLEEQLGSVKELESVLAKEREQTAQLKKQLAEVDSAAVRVQELESLLKLEREQTLDAKMQASVAESLGGRVRELEAILGKEREDRTQCEAQLAELQQAKNRLQELGATLHAERQAATQLTKQMAEMEQCQKLLQVERERNNLLAERMAETEQEAEQATKRFDEMARKLGEIAGLASQLGSGKRQP